MQTYTIPKAPGSTGLTLHGYATLRDAMAAIQSVAPGPVNYHTSNGHKWLKTPHRFGALNVSAFFEQG